jgi:CBS domain-containing protein
MSSPITGMPIAGHLLGLFFAPRRSAMNATLSRPTATPMMLSAQTAADLMVANPISLRSEAAAAEAIALFTEKGIAAAPVIDEAGRPIGVVSRSDLLIHQREAELNRSGKPDYFFAPTFERDPPPDIVKSSVVDLMTPAVFAVSPDTPVHQVVSDMLGLHVHRLFVVDDDGVLVGVISTMDILRRLKVEE